MTRWMAGRATTVARRRSHVPDGWYTPEYVRRVPRSSPTSTRISSRRPRPGSSRCSYAIRSGGGEQGHTPAGAHEPVPATRQGDASPEVADEFVAKIFQDLGTLAVWLPALADRREHLVDERRGSGDLDRSRAARPPRLGDGPDVDATHQGLQILVSGSKGDATRTTGGRGDMFPPYRLSVGSAVTGLTLAKQYRRPDDTAPAPPLCRCPCLFRGELLAADRI